jgi:23S rRNA pseudouridine1911/1915/1917 synthase
VRVDGVVEQRSSRLVGSGDRIEARLRVETLKEPVAANIGVNVIYSDDHVVVVDKPTGIAVHPGAGRRDGTLVNGLLSRFPQMANVGPADRPGVVHRLDLNTSGLLVFALTAGALETLGSAMRARKIKRTYTAVVRGDIQPPQGTIDAPIGRDPSNRTRQAIVESGRSARTHYRRVESIPGYSLLEIELETGRMHQIRVHLAAVGFPVIGDPTYRSASQALQAQVLPGLDRQFLHASRLQFGHPVSGEQLEFESPLPADLGSALDRLRTERQPSTL